MFLFLNMNVDLNNLYVLTLFYNGQWNHNYLIDLFGPIGSGPIARLIFPLVHLTTYIFGKVTSKGNHQPNWLIGFRRILDVIVVLGVTFGPVCGSCLLFLGCRFFIGSFFIRGF